MSLAHFPALPLWFRRGGLGLLCRYHSLARARNRNVSLGSTGSGS